MVIRDHGRKPGAATTSTLDRSLFRVRGRAKGSDRPCGSRGYGL